MCLCVMLIAVRSVKAQRAVIGPDVVKVYSLPMIDEKPIATVTFEGKAESQYTSLDTVHWGNVYLSDRSYGEIAKLSSDRSRSRP